MGMCGTSGIRYVLISLALMAGIILLLLVYGPALEGINEKDFLRLKLRVILMDKLTASSVYSYFPGSGSDGSAGKVLYVLGGNQINLKLKFAAAASLYHKGTVRRLLVLSVPGITEYDQSIQRNLTNDEWSTRELSKLGIRNNDVEFIHIKDGFFGTLSEAKTVARVLSRRGIKELLLVCSSYHGRRVGVAFSSYLKDDGVKMKIFSVDEKVPLTYLLVEYMKLILYENFLIPSEVHFGGTFGERSTIQVDKGTVKYKDGHMAIKEMKSKGSTGCRDGFGYIFTSLSIQEIWG